MISKQILEEKKKIINKKYLIYLKKNRFNR